MLQKYPIGIQNFREIREGGYVYVDKTKEIHQLVTTGKYYFLSRPRRFGKSLLVDTIEELYGGSQQLFKDLWIHDHWDWTRSNPVIHFSFANIAYEYVGLTEAIHRAIAENAENLGVEIAGDNIKDCFKELIEKASIKGKVVILIDEYDKPIIDFLDQPEVVESNRSTMQSFYSILKDADRYIRFLLITGVSQFSKVSIFSGLNNLDNITLQNQFGDIVGITQQELEENFSGEIAELQKKEPDILAQIKDWYNGYTWDLQTSVYNPFSLLKYMRYRKFQNYWYETGTPSFLVKILRKHTIYDIEGMVLSDLSLSTFDTEHPNPGSLLFQTGYLTIKGTLDDGDLYKLGYPNREVKESLVDGLLSAYREAPWKESKGLAANIRAALHTKDTAALVKELNGLIASIPFDYWRADTESIFTIISFLTFTLVGVKVYCEVHNAGGRCDVLIKTEKYIYVLELKLDGTAGEALAQIKEKGYLQPYAADPRKKIAIGISFSSETRGVEEYLVEEL